jgi:uncharacterized membrane protein YeiH
MTVDEPFLVIEYVGTAAYAVSGATVAIRAGMDWLGVAVLAVVCQRRTNLDPLSPVEY